MQSAITPPATAKRLHKFFGDPVVNHDQVLSDLLTAADAISGAIFAIFDFSTQRAVHYAEGMAKLTGYPEEFSYAGGIGFVMKITNPSDVQHLSLLQSGYVQEAKAPGFDQRAIRFHDYCWSLVNNLGQKIPVVSTDVVLTYTGQNDFHIGVGFIICEGLGAQSKLTECKQLLKQIKQRHNDIYQHAVSHDADGLYPLYHVNETKDLITRRERQVLGLLAQGCSSDEIALKLAIAVNTVESHRKKLLMKFNAKNTAHLIMKASKLFWLS